MLYRGWGLVLPFVDFADSVEKRKKWMRREGGWVSLYLSFLEAEKRDGVCFWFILLVHDWTGWTDWKLPLPLPFDEWLLAFLDRIETNPAGTLSMVFFDVVESTVFVSLFSVFYEFNHFGLIDFIWFLISLCVSFPVILSRRRCHSLFSLRLVSSSVSLLRHLSPSLHLSVSNYDHVLAITVPYV